MNAQKLIEDNNVKRQLLSLQNEIYYSDMLLYIRLQFSLSEQQTEEVLMEMLDHLLEGQKEGKTAQEIFGEDPRTFADQIIDNLPKAQKRELLPFLGGIIGTIVGWTLIIRGVLFFILSQMTEVNTTVHLVSSLAIAIVIAGFVSLVTVFILKTIEKSLFKEERGTRKDSMKVGLVGAISMTAVLLSVKYLPAIGPSFEFTWWVSLLIGVILLVGMKLMKKEKNCKLCD